MNMNMKEKGRQTRLLAAVAILAMVVCAFAVIVPSEDVEADTSFPAAVDGTITLTENIVLDTGNIYPEVMVIDGVGKYTITLNALQYFNKDVTFKNVTINTTDKATSKMLIASYAGANNTFTFNNVTFDIGKSTIYVDEGKTAVYNGCTFTSGTLAYGILASGAEASITVTNTKAGSPDISILDVNGITFGDQIDTDRVGNLYLSRTTGGVATELTIPQGVSLNVNSIYGTDQNGYVVNNGVSGIISVLGTLKTNGEISSTVKVSGSVNPIEPAGETVTADEIQDALEASGTAALPAGTVVTTELIPAIETGQTLIIPADSTIQDGSEFSVAVNGSIIFAGADDATFSVTGAGNTKASFTGATGNFTVTGGSIYINGTIAGDVQISGVTADANSTNVVFDGTTISGDLSISGTGNVTFNDVTIAPGADVTLGSGIDYSVPGEEILTNNGTISLADNVSFGVYGTLVNNGKVNGFSTTPVNTSFAMNWICGSIDSLVEIISVTTWYINGTCNKNLDLSDYTTPIVILAPGSTYTGIITYEVEIGDPATTYSASVDISATAGNVATQILSVTMAGSDVILKVSNSTVSDVSGDVSMENVSFADGMTLEAEITLSGDDNEIPTGHTLILGADGKITLADNAELYVYGNIEKTSAADAKDKINNDATGSKVYYTSQNKSAVLACVTNENNTALIGANGVGNLDDFKANSYPGSVIYLTADITITGTVELENVTIYTNGHSITVGDGNTGATLSLIGCTIDSEMPANVYQTENGPNAADTTVSDNEKIIIENKSVMEYQDSLIFVVVNAREGSSVEGSNDGVSYDNTASEVRVGYGTTLELKGRTVSAIDVFGDLVVTSTVTLSSGNAMNVYSGGTVTVDGTFSINGTADLKAGSVTVVSESGSITVGSKNGGSVMTVSGKLTVDGSFTVASPSGGSTARNDLAIAGGEFVVNGTMAMNDRFSGQIQDKGDVTINGTSNGGSVKVYAGVTLTVASVSGSMNVVDDGIVSINATLVQNGTSEQSNGNTITLTNVRGVTITETSETVNWVDDSKATHRDYVCYMDISGSITTASNGTIIVGGTTIGVGKDNDQYGTVTVDGELVLTKDIAMTVSGKLDVSGTVSAVIEGSSVTMNNGVLTVTGTVTVRDNEISGSGTINAAHYELAATADIIYDRHVYTDFRSAVEAAADAVMDTVDILGGVSAGEEVTVDAGITISIAANSRLSVSEGVTVTIADGATVTGYNSSSIRVYGTLTSLDYENDMEVKNIIADVVVTDGAARTWTSLANAVAGAGEGDVITTNGVIVISSDLTIPSGVTVYSEFPVYVTNEATLTVAGTMTMDVKAQAEKTLDGTPYHGLGINTGASVVVPGVMSVETQGQLDAEIGDDIDGAHFAIGDGAVTINYVSNVAFAAETVSGNADLIGNVTIKGAVTAGDVEFSVGEDQAAYSVLVNNHDYTDAVDTVFAFGTIGLNGVTLVIDDEISMASGTVSAPCGDGASEASVQLSRANGVTIASESSPLADGTLYTMTMTGISAGSATVASGTVALGTMTVTGGSVLTIASGATATVAANVQISIANEYGKNALVVEGTLDIADNGRIVAYNSNYGGVTVSGTMQVGTFTIASGLQYDVTGTIAVDNGRVMTVNGLVIVGDKPASLGEQASGTITGTVSISAISIGILAYAGADLGDADINLNAATGESNALITSYVINGTEYATLYVNSVVKIYNIETIDGVISLSGLSTSGEWYATQQDAERGENPVAYYDFGVVSADVGDYATVYAYYHPSTVLGTISKDAGIILTIDGLVVAPSGGYGDQSFKTSIDLSVGTHTVSWSERSGYTFADVTVTFNGVEIENGGTITITADMQPFTLIVSGSEPSVAATGGDDGMGLTDYLLIVLVVLIVVMAIMVALRLMRS